MVAFLKPLYRRDVSQLQHAAGLCWALTMVSLATYQDMPPYFVPSIYNFSVIAFP
jgi:hypothetical protein